MISQPFSISFWRAYLITMRPYLLFVSGVTGLTGISFVHGIPVLDRWLLFLVFFLSYGFGQALTDCFQTDTDALSSPYRPLVQGKLARHHVLTVSLIGLVISGLLLTFYHPWNLPLCVLAVFGLWTYTYFKRRWWAGPFYNAWIVMVLMGIAFLAGLGAARQSFYLPQGFWFYAAAVFFGYANFVLTGYYKDVSADRQTGYNTLPVVYGFQRSNWVSDLFAILTWLPVFLQLTRQPNIGAFFFFLIGTLCLINGQFKLHQVKDETQAHQAIVPVVDSYILLLSTLILLHQPDWLPGMLVYFLAYRLVMHLRPCQEQI